MQKVRKKKMRELRIEFVPFDDCLHSDFVHSIFHPWHSGSKRDAIKRRSRYSFSKLFNDIYLPLPNNIPVITFDQKLSKNNIRYYTYKFSNQQLKLNSNIF